MHTLPLNPSESIPAYIDRANSLRLKGELNEALRVFEGIPPGSGEHAGLVIEKSIILRELGRLGEAGGLLEEWLARCPDSAGGWIQLGHVARRRGDRETALAHFQAARALAPGNEDAALQTASELRELGRLGEAEPLILGLFPNSQRPVELWRQLGHIALCRDDSEEATRCFREGIGAQPSSEACYIDLAHEWMRLGMFDVAGAVLEEGVEKVADPWQLNLMHARLLKSLGHKEAALERALAPCESGSAETASLLAELYLDLADFEATEAWINSLPSATPGHKFAMAMLQASLCRARYELEEAESWVRQALGYEGKSIEAWNLLSAIQITKGDLENGKTALRAAQNLMASHASARIRKQAKRAGPLMFLREAYTNPFIIESLREACTLPLERRHVALAKVLENEPGYQWSSIAFLVSLRRSGAFGNARPTGKPAGSPIPRRVIQYWDSAEIPDDLHHTMRSWPQACLGFEHQIFNDHSAQALIEAEYGGEVLQAFRSLNHPAARADIFRLAYLARRGGVYADADDLCRHSIGSLLEPGIGLVLLQEDVGSIGNNFIAAMPGHPFIEAALAAAVKMVLEKQGDCIWFLTGPGLMSWVFCHHYLDDLSRGGLREGVSILDCYHLGRFISMHLPRRYKQDSRHWNNPEALNRPLFRPPLPIPMPPRQAHGCVALFSDGQGRPFAGRS